jgi:hypothetical protein
MLDATRAGRVNSGVRHLKSIADVVVAESKIHGLGVFATRDFAEGEILLPIDDSCIVDDAHTLQDAPIADSFMPFFCEWCPDFSVFCASSVFSVTLW